MDEGTCEEKLEKSIPKRKKHVEAITKVHRRKQDNPKNISILSAKASNSQKSITSTPPNALAIEDLPSSSISNEFGILKSVATTNIRQNVSPKKSAFRNVSSSVPPAPNVGGHTSTINSLNYREPVLESNRLDAFVNRPSKKCKPKFKSLKSNLDDARGGNSAEQSTKPGVKLAGMHAQAVQEEFKGRTNDKASSSSAFRKQNATEFASSGSAANGSSTQDFVNNVHRRKVKRVKSSHQLSKMQESSPRLKLSRSKSLNCLSNDPEFTRNSNISANLLRLSGEICPKQIRIVLNRVDELRKPKDNINDALSVNKSKYCAESREPSAKNCDKRRKYFKEKAKSDNVVRKKVHSFEKSLKTVGQQNSSEEQTRYESQNNENSLKTAATTVEQCKKLDHIIDDIYSLNHNTTRSDSSSTYSKQQKSHTAQTNMLKQRYIITCPKELKIILSRCDGDGPRRRTSGHKSDHRKSRSKSCVRSFFGNVEHSNVSSQKSDIEASISTSDRKRRSKSVSRLNYRTEFEKNIHSENFQSKGRPRRSKSSTRSRSRPEESIESPNILNHSTERDINEPIDRRRRSKSLSRLRAITANSENVTQTRHSRSKSSARNGSEKFDQIESSDNERIELDLNEVKTTTNAFAKTTSLESTEDYSKASESIPTRSNNSILNVYNNSQNESAAPRKRGRPRKRIQELSDDFSNDVQRRGSPRKQIQELSDEFPNDVRKRGRPQKQIQELSNKFSNDVRRRGSPREQIQELSDDFSNDVRKRGRPRKQIQELSNEFSNDVRRRGRPRKHIKELSDDMSDKREVPARRRSLRSKSTFNERPIDPNIRLTRSKSCDRRLHRVTTPHVEVEECQKLPNTVSEVVTKPRHYDYVTSYLMKPHTSFADIFRSNKVLTLPQSVSKARSIRSKSIPDMSNPFKNTSNQNVSPLSKLRYARSKSFDTPESNIFELSTITRNRHNMLTQFRQIEQFNETSSESDKITNDSSLSDLDLTNSECSEDLLVDNMYDSIQSLTLDDGQHKHNKHIRSKEIGNFVCALSKNAREIDRIAKNCDGLGINSDQEPKMNRKRRKSLARIAREKDCDGEKVMALKRESRFTRRRSLNNNVSNDSSDDSEIMLLTKSPCQSFAMRATRAKSCDITLPKLQAKSSRRARSKSCSRKLNENINLDLSIRSRSRKCNKGEPFTQSENVLKRSKSYSDLLTKSDNFSVRSKRSKSCDRKRIVIGTKLNSDNSLTDKECDEILTNTMGIDIFGINKFDYVKLKSELRRSKSCDLKNLCVDMNETVQNENKNNSGQHQTLENVSNNKENVISCEQTIDTVSENDLCKGISKPSNMSPAKSSESISNSLNHIATSKRRTRSKSCVRETSPKRDSPRIRKRSKSMVRKKNEEIDTELNKHVYKSLRKRSKSESHYQFNQNSDDETISDLKQRKYSESRSFAQEENVKRTLLCPLLPVVLLHRLRNRDIEKNNRLHNNSVETKSHLENIDKKSVLRKRSKSFADISKRSKAIEPRLTRHKVKVSKTDTHIEVKANDNATENVSCDTMEVESKRNENEDKNIQVENVESKRNENVDKNVQGENVESKLNENVDKNVQAENLNESIDASIYEPLQVNVDNCAEHCDNLGYLCDEEFSSDIIELPSNSDCCSIRDNLQSPNNESEAFDEVLDDTSVHVNENVFPTPDSDGDNINAATGSYVYNIVDVTSESDVDRNVSEQVPEFSKNDEVLECANNSSTTETVSQAFNEIIPFENGDYDKFVQRNLEEIARRTIVKVVLTDIKDLLKVVKEKLFKNNDFQSDSEVQQPSDEFCEGQIDSNTPKEISLIVDVEISKETDLSEHDEYDEQVPNSIDDCIVIDETSCDSESSIQQFSKTSDDYIVLDEASSDILPVNDQSQSQLPETPHVNENVIEEHNSLQSEDDYSVIENIPLIERMKKKVKIQKSKVRKLKSKIKKSIPPSEIRKSKRKMSEGSKDAYDHFRCLSLLSQQKFWSEGDNYDLIENIPLSLRREKVKCKRRTKKPKKSKVLGNSHVEANALDSAIKSYVENDGNAGNVERPISVRSQYNDNILENAAKSLAEESVNTGVMDNSDELEYATSNDNCNNEKIENSKVTISSDDYEICGDNNPGNIIENDQIDEELNENVTNTIDTEKLDEIDVPEIFSGSERTIESSPLSETEHFRVSQERMDISHIDEYDSDQADVALHDDILKGEIDAILPEHRKEQTSPCDSVATSPEFYNSQSDVCPIRDSPEVEAEITPDKVNISTIEDTSQSSIDSIVFVEQIPNPLDDCSDVLDKEGISTSSDLAMNKVNYDTEATPEILTVENRCSSEANKVLDDNEENNDYLTALGLIKKSVKEVNSDTFGIKPPEPEELIQNFYNDNEDGNHSSNSTEVTPIDRNEIELPSNNKKISLEESVAEKTTDTNVLPTNEVDKTCDEVSNSSQNDNFQGENCISHDIVPSTEIVALDDENADECGINNYQENESNPETKTSPEKETFEILENNEELHHNEDPIIEHKEPNTSNMIENVTEVLIKPTEVADIDETIPKFEETIDKVQLENDNLNETSEQHGSGDNTYDPSVAKRDSMPIVLDKHLNNLESDIREGMIPNNISNDDEFQENVEANVDLTSENEALNKNDTLNEYSDASNVEHKVTDFAINETHNETDNEVYRTLSEEEPPITEIENETKSPATDLEGSSTNDTDMTSNCETLKQISCSILENESSEISDGKNIEISQNDSNIRSSDTDKDVHTYKEACREQTIVTDCDINKTDIENVPFEADNDVCHKLTEEVSLENCSSSLDLSNIEPSVKHDVIVQNEIPQIENKSKGLAIDSEDCSSNDTGMALNSDTIKPSSGAILENKSSEIPNRQKAETSQTDINITNSEDVPLLNSSSSLDLHIIDGVIVQNKIPEIENESKGIATDLEDCSSNDTDIAPNIDTLKQNSSVILEKESSEISNWQNSEFSQNDDKRSSDTCKDVNIIEACHKETIVTDCDINKTFNANFNGETDSEKCHKITEEVISIAEIENENKNFATDFVCSDGTNMVPNIDTLKPNSSKILENVSSDIPDRQTAETSQNDIEITNSDTEKNVHSYKDVCHKQTIMTDNDINKTHNKNEHFEADNDECHKLTEEVPSLNSSSSPDTPIVESEEDVIANNKIPESKSDDKNVVECNSSDTDIARSDETSKRISRAKLENDYHKIADVRIAEKCPSACDIRPAGISETSEQIPEQEMEVQDSNFVETSTISENTNDNINTTKENTTSENLPVIENASEEKLSRVIEENTLDDVRTTISDELGDQQQEALLENKNLSLNDNDITEDFPLANEENLDKVIETTISSGRTINSDDNIFNSQNDFIVDVNNLSNSIEIDTEKQLRDVSTDNVSEEIVQANDSMKVQTVIAELTSTDEKEIISSNQVSAEHADNSYRHNLRLKDIVRSTGETENDICGENSADIRREKPENVEQSKIATGQLSSEDLENVKEKIIADIGKELHFESAPDQIFETDNDETESLNAEDMPIVAKENEVTGKSLQDEMSDDKNDFLKQKKGSLTKINECFDKIAKNILKDTVVINTDLNDLQNENDGSIIEDSLNYSCENALLDTDIISDETIVSQDEDELDKNVGSPKKSDKSNANKMINDKQEHFDSESNKICDTKMVGQDLNVNKVSLMEDSVEHIAECNEIREGEFLDSQNTEVVDNITEIFSSNDNEKQAIYSKICENIKSSSVDNLDESDKELYKNNTNELISEGANELSGIDDNSEDEANLFNDSVPKILSSRDVLPTAVNENTVFEKDDLIYMEDSITEAEGSLQSNEDAVLECSDIGISTLKTKETEVIDEMFEHQVDQNSSAESEDYISNHFDECNGEIAVKGPDFYHDIDETYKNKDKTLACEVSDIEEPDILDKHNSDQSLSLSNSDITIPTIFDETLEITNEEHGIDVPNADDFENTMRKNDIIDFSKELDVLCGNTDEFCNAGARFAELKPTRGRSDTEIYEQLPNVICEDDEEPQIDISSFITEVPKKCDEQMSNVAENNAHFNENTIENEKAKPTFEVKKIKIVRTLPKLNISQFKGDKCQANNFFNLNNTSAANLDLRPTKEVKVSGNCVEIEVTSDTNSTEVVVNQPNKRPIEMSQYTKITKDTQINTKKGFGRESTNKPNVKVATENPFLRLISTETCESPILCVKKPVRLSNLFYGGLPKSDGTSKKANEVTNNVAAKAKNNEKKSALREFFEDSSNFINTVDTNPSPVLQSKSAKVVKETTTKNDSSDTFNSVNEVLMVETCNSKTNKRAKRSLNDAIDNLRNAKKLKVIPADESQLPVLSPNIIEEVLGVADDLADSDANGSDSTISTGYSPTKTINVPPLEAIVNKTNQNRGKIVITDVINLPPYHPKKKTSTGDQSTFATVSSTPNILPKNDNIPEKLPEVIVVPYDPNSKINKAGEKDEIELKIKVDTNKISAGKVLLKPSALSSKIGSQNVFAKRLDFASNVSKNTKLFNVATNKPAMFKETKFPFTINALLDNRKPKAVPTENPARKAKRVLSFDFETPTNAKMPKFDDGTTNNVSNFLEKTTQIVEGDSADGASTNIFMTAANSASNVNGSFFDSKKNESNIFMSKFESDTSDNLFMSKATSNMAESGAKVLDVASPVTKAITESPKNLFMSSIDADSSKCGSQTLELTEKKTDDCDKVETKPVESPATSPPDAKAKLKNKIPKRVFISHITQNLLLKAFKQAMSKDSTKCLTTEQVLKEIPFNELFQTKNDFSFASEDQETTASIADESQKIPDEMKPQEVAANLNGGSITFENLSDNSNGFNELCAKYNDSKMVNGGTVFKNSELTINTKKVKCVTFLLPEVDIELTPKKSPKPYLKVKGILVKKSRYETHDDADAKQTAAEVTEANKPSVVEIINLVDSPPKDAPAVSELPQFDVEDLLKPTKIVKKPYNHNFENGQHLPPAKRFSGPKSVKNRRNAASTEAPSVAKKEPKVVVKKLTEDCIEKYENKRKYRSNLKKNFFKIQLQNKKKGKIKKIRKISKNIEENVIISKCLYCKESFSYDYEFEAHINKHVGMLNMYCSPCQSYFCDQDDFRSHFLNHYKIYICRSCDFVSNNRTNMKNHACSVIVVDD